MSVLEAILIGIIQGLTEFLPVSSSGHIELAEAILKVKPKGDELLFSVIVHGATALSTIVIFWKDIFGLLKGLFTASWNEEKEMLAKIALSMLPVLAVYFTYKDELEALFDGKILLVGSMLILTGLLLTLTNFLDKKTDRPVNFWQALVIGIAQAIAILPGISRSGSTIATALLLGVGREQAARFSFLMVLVPILGATALKVKDYLEDPTAAESISAAALGAGFLAAFLTGTLACLWMIRLVKRGKLIYFGAYC
ncbi:MAG: undecaprenyl-diphosphate phosphatase, partial [Bacteroidota bacterium]